MEKRFMAFILVAVVGAAMCGCGNFNNDDMDLNSETDDSVNDIYDASETSELEIGDLSLIESNVELEDYSDIDLGVDCNFSFVVENNSGITLTSISVNCSILDSDGNILGTSDAWIYAEILDGVKATANGSFNLDDYPDAAMIKA